DPDALGVADTRNFFLGNSYSVYSVTWLVQQLFLARGLFGRERPAEALLARGSCPLSWGEVGSCTKSAVERDRKLAAQLTGEFLAINDRNGSDIRLGVGLPHRPRARPRASISPFSWHRRAFSLWRQGRADVRIDARELQAGIAALLWRSRPAKHLNARFAHPFDSQVAASIATKGDHPASGSNSSCEKWAALCAAGGLYPVMGYIATEGDPAHSAKRSTRLRLLRVSAATLGRHRAALRTVLDHWGAAGLQPSEPLDVDEGVSECIEMLWGEDQPVSKANYAVASVDFFFASVQQSLGLSWSLLKAWRRREPPVRALPFTPELILAMAAVAIERRGCCARQLELFTLRKKLVATISGDAIVRLPETKTVHRKATTGMVAVDCPIAAQLARQWYDGAAPLETTSRRPPSQLRACLQKLPGFFHLDGFRLSRYSCRRGGATYDFMPHQSMETTIMRGRWG
ncbi:unnamed protein product, partial [Prorocentrum cordatum]